MLNVSATALLVTSPSMMLMARAITSVPLAPGSLATLFSNRLATDKTLISATTWPTTAANRQVVINDETPAPLYYLEAGQVNFQMPSNAPVGSSAMY